MCGIAGYIGPTPPAEERVSICFSLMGRRGPDATGIYRHETELGWSVCMLHSRLAIIDLDERAGQPMSHGGKRLVVNGEIYNYVEIRKELEARGECDFRTTSDSEVLLRALSRDGMNALDRVEGMFAFALFDEVNSVLTLARDRFAEKPLYLYAENDGGVYFGSEVKFIQALSGEKLHINQRQICRFIVNGYRALNKTGETFWHGVRELSGGSIMEIRPGREKKEARYWTLSPKENEGLSYNDAVAGARKAVIDAVKLRLRADVPLAFCMSGGVDSNGLISIARNVLNYDVHGFTIVNRHERYAEQDMVDQAVSAQGLRHTAIELTTDGFLNRLNKLVAYHDAPVYTISAYVHWLLMEAVSEHGYKTVISGTGADELFSGYYDHHLLYLADLAGDPERHREALGNWRTHIEPLTQNPLLMDPDLFVHNPDAREHLYMNASLFNGYLRVAFDEPFTETVYTSGNLRNRMLNELFVETLPPPMHEEDLNAMYWSVENRSPYLDRHLAEFCATIPTRHLVQDGKAKAVLRDAMRGIVPDQIIDNRRKMGFNAPLMDLLDVSDSEVRSMLLDDSPIYDIVDRAAIERLLGNPDPDHSHNLFLFYVLSSKIFMDQHC